MKKIKKLIGLTLAFTVMSQFLVFNTALAKAKPTKVSYSAIKGNFLFCNNPEKIIFSDLGDAGSIIYSDIANKGDVQALYEHTNKTGCKISYGIQVYNTNNKDVTINITNKGEAVSWTGFEIWKSFFDSNSKSITLKSGKSVWISELNGIGDGQPFSGVVRFTTSADVLVNFIAYKDKKNLTGHEKYEGYIGGLRFGADQTDVYKGKAVTVGSNNFVFPMLIGNFSWSIDDTDIVGSYLPVTYNGAGTKNNNAIMWRTNKNEKDFYTADTWDPTIPGALLSDMLEFITPRKDGTTRIKRMGNLGNWGVQYVDRITINNSSKKTRTIEIGAYVHASEGSEKNVVFKTPSIFGGYKSKSFNKNGEYVIYTFNLKPGETLTKEIQSILSTPSSGDISHYVKIVK